MYSIDNLHDKIKQLCARKGILLKELAKNMGISEQTLYNILKREGMAMEKFLAMAEGLNMHPKELMGVILDEKTHDTPPLVLNDEGEKFKPNKSDKYNELLTEVIRTNRIIEDILTNK